MSGPIADVDEVADRFLDGVLERDPVSATRIGDERWNDQLSDYGEGGRAADAAACRETLTMAEAFDPQQLDDEQAVTLEMLILLARNRLEALEQKQYQLAVDHMDGVQNLPMEIAQYQPAERPDQLDALLARFAAYPGAIAQHIATLREGIGDSRTSATAPVRKTIEQIEQLLATPVSDFPAVSMARVANEAARDRVGQAVEHYISPALQALHDFLTDAYEPMARSEPGLSTTPDGEAAYELAIRLQTTLPAGADEIHRFGLEEVERIEAEMDELARRLGYPDRQPLRRQLFEDPANLSTSRQPMLDLANDRIRLAEARAGRFFRRLPRAACIVKSVEEYREALMGTYYMPPAPDGSRPGQYYLNTSSGMPRHLLPALTFHEATPGHHFQLAIEMELSGLPRFRTQLSGSIGDHERRGGPPLIGSAFIEGWAMYAERLADEMGLYATEVERLGLLEHQLLRALRLVAEPGLHDKGWSREQAIGFMQRAGVPRAFAEMEVDRYTVLPGQALAYKVGQREIERARREVSGQMGDRFDLAVFHDQVLGHGTLPLTIFRRKIPGWVAAATQSA